MPELQARIGGVLVSPSNPVTFAALDTPVQVDLRFSEAFTNAAAVPVSVPAGFNVTIGGSPVTELPAGYLTNVDAPVYFRQTAKLAQGSSPNVSLTVGDTSILLEAISGEPPENLPPVFIAGPYISLVTHNSATLSAAYSDPDGDAITAHYRLNGGSWLAFSSPVSLSSLTPETAYIAEVRLTTAQHEVIESVGFSTAVAPEVPDTEAPVIAGTLTATAGDTQVTLTGPTATDNVGIAKWQRRHRIVAGTWPADWTDIVSTSTTMPSTVVSGLTNGTGYEFEIRAADAAGNFSAVRSATATPVSASLPTSGTAINGTIIAATLEGQQTSIFARTGYEARVFVTYDEVDEDYATDCLVYRNGTQIATAPNHLAAFLGSWAYVRMRVDNVDDNPRIEFDVSNSPSGPWGKSTAPFNTVINDTHASKITGSGNWSVTPTARAVSFESRD